MKFIPKKLLRPFLILREEESATIVYQKEKDRWTVKITRSESIGTDGEFIDIEELGRLQKTH